MYNRDGEYLLRGTDWVFMCFVWISEQTAIISLYNINWLVCITERECVYCAVRTECSPVTQPTLHSTHLLLLPKRQTAKTGNFKQAVGQQSLQKCAAHCGLLWHSELYSGEDLILEKRVAYREGFSSPFLRNVCNYVLPDWKGCHRRLNLSLLWKLPVVELVIKLLSGRPTGARRSITVFTKASRCTPSCPCPGLTLSRTYSAPS